MESLKRRSGWIRLSVAALLCSAVQWAVAAPPAVLDTVPDQADIVIVLKDIQSASAKLANLGTRLGMPVPPDPVNMMLQNMGITEGIDQSGSIGMYVVIPEPNTSTGDAPIVILLPASNAKLVIQSLNGSVSEGGITAITLPTDDIGYAATVGNFVAIAQDKQLLVDLLAKKTSITKAMAPQVLSSFEKNDLVVYANVEHFANQALEMLQSIRVMLPMMMASQGDPSEVPMDILGLYFDGLEQVLKDTQSGAMTLRLTDDATTLGFTGHFKADSMLGNIVTSMKPLDVASALKGLPDGNPIFVVSNTLDGATFAPLVTKFTDAILKTPQVQALPNVDKLKEIYAVQAQAVGMMSSLKLACYEPLNAKENGLIRAVGITTVSDPATYQNLIKSTLENISNMPISPELTMTSEEKLGVTSIKGTPIDLYTFFLKPTEESSPKAQQAMQFFNTLYGQRGVTNYVSAVGKDMIQILGGDQKLAEAAVNAVRDGGNPLSGKIGNVELVPNTVGFAYFYADRFINVLQSALDIPPQTAGAAAPPIVISAGVTNSILTKEIMLPTATLGKLISSGAVLKDAIEDKLESGSYEYENDASIEQ